MPIPGGAGSPIHVTSPVPGDFSGSINGLAFGPGTPYNVVSLSGWKSQKSSPLGGMSSGVSSLLPSPKGFDNGAWPVAYWSGPREVGLTFNVVATSAVSFQAAMAALEAATLPTGSGTATLSIQLDGVTTTVSGAVPSREPATDFAYQFGLSVVPITFVAEDPRRMAANVMGVSSLPSTTGGLTVPFTVPFQINSTLVSGVVSLTNTGNTTGPLSFTISGPCTGPSITHRQTGLVLAFSSGFTVNSGDTLAIDAEAQTVLYNGQASRSAFVTNRGWPQFVPGANTYAFTAASYSPTASLSVTATPAYL